jgi:hypothetical protein
MSVVFYFMHGCPACEATWPTWKKAKKMMMHAKEVEARQVSPDKNVNSFPTFVVEDENGLEIKRVEGRQSDPRMLIRELGVKPRKSKTRKSKTRPRTTRRRIR